MVAASPAVKYPLQRRQHWDNMTITI